MKAEKASAGEDFLRAKGMMGLAVRAGRAVFGEEGCLRAIRSGRCALLLLEETASAATREKYARACGKGGVVLRLLPDGLLQEAAGRPGVAMAVTDGGFAERLKALLPEDDTESSQADAPEES